MIKIIFFCLFLSCFSSCDNTSCLKYSVCFSPEGNCETLVIKEIQSSRKSIVIAMYSLTSSRIIDALVDVKKNSNVPIWILLEEDQNKEDIIYKLKSNGINVRLDGNPALMHNKFAVIDEKVVITGSYNFTVNANLKNNENLIIIYDSDLANDYLNEFNKLWNEGLDI